MSADQLWFSRSGDDLTVSVIGTSDQIVIDNWYLGSQYHIEQVRTADGKTLQDTQVDALVNAMAAFAPPAAGQTTLTPQEQATLAPVIAASWA